MRKNIRDSRDIRDRAAELFADFESWKADLIEEEIQAIAETYNVEIAALEEENFMDYWQTGTSEGEEHKSIIDLKEEINSNEWDHGLTLIEDSYFETYAREFAEDIGAISGEERWPATCIDWEKAASELQMDYSSVDFDGETYWYRE